MKRITRFLIQTAIVLSLLLSPTFTSPVSAAADDIIVSGITSPSDANGTYTVAGTNNGLRYWKLTAGANTYYVYNDVYTAGGSVNYWNIDSDMEDEVAVLFYSSSPSSDVSPVGLYWTKDKGVGTPVLVNGTPVPNILVSGNGYSISRGSTTISSTNFTNFGAASTSGGTASRTFTIRNNGSAALTLSGSSPYITISGTNAANFQVTGTPPAQSIPASSGTTTFTITFTPTFEGYANAVVTINSNDPDEGVFSFDIQGYGFVARNIILSGLTEPSAANGTYIHQGVINNFQYWKHQTLNYYIYAGIYIGTNYWNIDNDTDLTHGYFFKVSEDGTPVGLTGWTADTGVTPLPTGAPVINYAVLAPEINVKGNGISIVSNDSTPSLADQTKFGAVDISGGSRTRTYTIENSGGAALTISSVTLGGDDASEFSKTNPVLTSIPAGSNTTFTVTFDPSTVGTKTATISIANNDSDENPYLFYISGEGFISKNLFVSNITTPSAANGTYIYKGILNEFPYWKHESQEYYIFNDEYTSSYYWNIDANTIDTDTNFLFFRGSEAAVPVGLTGWSVNTAAGFESSGAPVVDYAGPEMDVKGIGNSIADGSSAPVTTNYTDFGSVSVASGAVSHSFTISNTGSFDLTLGGTPKVAISGTNAGDFSVTAQPTSPVAATTGTTIFTVEFNPSGVGTRSATISIANDDSDENPYNFSIQGTGVSAPAVTTSAASSVTGTGATLGGNVTSDGAAAVTERGFVYSSINTAPTIGGANVTQDTSGTGTGVFNEAISSLTAATHYYYQAYATNSEGTTYGGVEEFTTLNAITSINRVGSSSTNASSVSWTVEFGAALTGLTASNFSLVNSGLTGPAITGVSGSGTTWTVTADTGTGSGTLGLNLINATGLSESISNTLPYAGQTFTIDKIAPSAPTIIGISSGYFNSNQIFTVSGEAGASIEYTTNNGGLWNAYSGAVTLSAEGTYDILARQTDQAGNGPTATSIFTVTIDKSAPSAPTISGISAGNFNSNQTFTVSGEAGDTIEYSTNNGGLWTAYSGAVTLSAEGTYSVLARQTDQAGNGPTASGVITLTIDKTAPSSPNIIGISTGLYNSNQIFTVMGEAGASIEYSTNNGALWTPYTGAVTLSADGTYILMARQTDEAGNGPTTSGTITLTIDKTAPPAPTISGISAGYFNTNQTFTVSGEVGTTLEYSTNNGGLWTAYAGAVTLSAEGTYNILARQTDQAGNGSIASSVITLTIDKIAPTVDINQAAGQADPAGSAPVNFTVTFSENVTGFATGDVNLGTSTTPGTLIGTVTGGPATYNVAVSGMTGDGTIIASIAAGIAQDAAGNTNIVSISSDNSVSYDTVAPGVTINQATGQVDPTNAGPIHFTVVFTEPITGFTSGDVTLTSALAGLTRTVTEIAPMNGTTFDVSVGGLSGGGTVTASIAAGAATDAALHGNTASSSTDNTVTFDAAAPETTIDTHPAISITTTSATFTFSATDAGTGVAGFECSLDAAAFSTCTSPRNLTGLSGGSHTFQVRATDNIGNTDSTPASFIWTVDATAPVVNTFTVTSPSTSRNIPVTDFTATDDIAVTGYLVTTTATAPAAGASGWSTFPPVTFTVAADGSYTLYPWAKDAAGRVSAVFGTPRNVTVDATAPSVTINQAAGQADPVKTGPVNFTAVFSEPVTGFTASDVSLFGSTAPGVTVTGIFGGPTTYTVVATASGDGAIVISLPTGAALDAYSNPSSDSTSTDNSVTLDSTSPTITIDNIVPDPTNAGATVTWHSDDNGTYSVRVGGTNCVTGTQIISSTYSTSPATLNSVIPSANLAAGVNTVRVCVTDGAANSGSTTGTVTKVLTPIVTTTAATAVGNASATLRGTVNANGSSTTVQFEYGLTVAYGTTVTATPATATGSANTNVSAAITGLTPNTTYHYRASGTNANGTTNGGDQTFTTSDLSITLRFHDVIHANVNWASIGDLLHVQADVTHSNPATPTGSLVFTRYNNVSCYGAGTAAGTMAMAATVEPSQSTALTANGLSFKARYAGDSNYPAVESPCARISTTWNLSILPESTGTHPHDGITVSGGLNSLVVQFNSDVLHNNATDVHSVLNPANFLLVSQGANNAYDTVNCAGGVVADDSAVTVDSVSYNAATYAATVNVNGGTRLPVGYYRLFVCGTTSISDPAGALFLNGHADDSRISFRVIPGSGSSSRGSSDPDDAENVKRLPATGFAPNSITRLSVPPVEYTDNGDLRLEIPRLGVTASIMGVPVSQDGAAWDVTWLGRNAGWLNGTAFPSFAGNSVITGHVWDADNKPGIFVDLKNLGYGDKVVIHAYGQVYIYEVRETKTITPDEVRSVIRHEENPWVTLVTCEEYDAGAADYVNRRVVRAVLINVTEE